MRFLLRSLLVLCLAAPAAGAETVEGRARVIDGDTLAIGAVHVRLFGIDAPEHDQNCDRDGVVWACGQAAAQALAKAVGRARLVCEVKDRDRYGRMVSICWRGRADLGEVMVAQGAAMAYRRYSQRYAAVEDAARVQRMGIWAARMETPEAYRHGDAQLQAGTCAIKGNIGTHGRIYHMPGQADYAATRINEQKGERWFCTEGEARAAGFRRAAR